MPRFFDDYSNTYLTHDSAAGRKQQRRGWKFRENFKLHYEKYLEEWRAGPMGLASAQQAFLRTRRNPATGQIVTDETVPPLPEGWKEELDEATGIYYYINEESGERSWVRPGFRPPGPPGPMGGLPPPMMRGVAGGPPPPMMMQPPPAAGFRQPPPQFPPPPGKFKCVQCVAARLCVIEFITMTAVFVVPSEVKDSFFGV
eukprot:CCRYP_016284-RA/>CCRYP_016284-RA protein AED:0.04 eAED:0.04 QI:302/1/1/1/1/1/2/546/199